MLLSSMPSVKIGKSQTNGWVTDWMSRWMGGRAQEKSGNYRATSQFMKKNQEILSGVSGEDNRMGKPHEWGRSEQTE